MPIGTEGFIGSRLTEAREARGLSLTSLVELLEGAVTVAAISQYEKETSSPRIEIAELLANKLDCQLSFFFKKTNSQNQDTLYWRSFASATKTARTRAKRRFIWLKEITAYLKNYLEFPDVNLPSPEDIGVPKNPLELLNLSSWENQVENIVDRCREFWKLGDSPINNFISLLEKNGVIVSRASIYSEKLDAFSQFSSTDQTPYVFLSLDKNSAVRSRLDAAHELGHLILHRNISEEAISSKETLSILENQAFYFGAALLLPKKTFSEDFRYPTLDSFLYLKRKWHVSIGAMIKRAKGLNLIRDDQAKNLWMNHARRGWKKMEPLDESLQPEYPKLLKQGFEILIKEGIKTSEQIIQEITLPQKDIEELAGLPSGYFSENHHSIKFRIKAENEFEK